MKNKIIYDESIPEFGDLFTVQEFVDSVKLGFLIDYDGSGQLVRDDKMSKECILPSKINTIPDCATHVLWFNK